MNLGQVADLCLRAKPEWNRANTVRNLLTWQRQHDATIEQVAEMAAAAIQLEDVQTPAALAWQPAPAPEDQPAFAGLTIHAPEPDQPDAQLDCEHGVSLWAKTKTGEPQCPTCRGVTRAKRNRFVPGFRMAGYRPCEADSAEPTPAEAGLSHD